MREILKVCFVAWYFTSCFFLILKKYYPTRHVDGLLFFKLITCYFIGLILGVIAINGGFCASSFFYSGPALDLSLPENQIDDLDDCISRPSLENLDYLVDYLNHTKNIDQMIDKLSQEEREELIRNLNKLIEKDQKNQEEEANVAALDNDTIKMLKYLTLTLVICCLIYYFFGDYYGFPPNPPKSK